MRALLCGGVLVLGACGASHGAGPNPGTDAPVVGDAPAADANGADAAWSWQPLLSEQWTMDANDWGYRCAEVPITQDAWIDGFRPIAGMGSGNDHQIVLVTNQSSPADCSSREIYDQDELLYASGLGPNEELDLPAGDAVHVVPGTAAQPNYILLYSHVVNETASALGGSSGVEVHYADPAAVVHDVDMVLGGTQNFTAPANDQPYTATGDCLPTVTAGYQWHLVALWPHMHESGTHATVSIENSGGAITTLLDTSYSYLNEAFYPAHDALLDTGGALEVQCTIQDAGAKPLEGDWTGSLLESAGHTTCWTGIYKYPTGTDPASSAQGSHACLSTN